MAEIFVAKDRGKTIKISAEGGTGYVCLNGLQPSTTVMYQHSSDDQSVNLQIVPTLGKDIYLFSNGDRPGTITFSGLVFYHSCDGDDGLYKVLNFYKQNKADGPGKLVDAQLTDGLLIRGYLTAVRAGYDNPELNAGSFTLTVTTTQFNGS